MYRCHKFSDMDQIMSLWVPRKQGNSPTHFVVLRHGHIFCIEPLIGDEPWTAPELERAFQKICDEAEHLRGKPTIAALTRDPRDTWAENREYLMKLGKLFCLQKVTMLCNLVSKIILLTKVAYYFSINL